MVKHIILWNLKENLSPEEKAEAMKNAKKGLESLDGRIDGLLKITVNIENLPSSNCDMMLDSEFVSAQALKNYAANPEHNRIADTFVRPFTAKRSCFDYEV